jgi:hypothetical protein
MTTSPYLRRPLRSYAEVAAERPRRQQPADIRPGPIPDRHDDDPMKAAAPAEAGDD